MRNAELAFEILEKGIKIEAVDFSDEIRRINTKRYYMRKDDKTFFNVQVKLEKEINELLSKNLAPSTVIFGRKMYEHLVAQNYEISGSVLCSSYMGLKFEVDGSKDAPHFKVLCTPEVEMFYRY